MDSGPCSAHGIIASGRDEVHAYRRSAAGRLVGAAVRDAATLWRHTRHLLDCCMGDAGVPLPQRYRYVSDRLRAVRSDMTRADDDLRPVAPAILQAMIRFRQ